MCFYADWKSTVGHLITQDTMKNSNHAFLRHYKLEHTHNGELVKYVITYLITSIFPIRKHRKCHSDQPMGRYRDKNLITRYQAFL